MHLSFLCVDQIQVEAERTEVLRLAAELNDLRAASEQDAIAARKREAALKAMLASETEVRKCATAHFEGKRFLRSLFLCTQEEEIRPTEQLVRHQTAATKSQTLSNRVQRPTYERKLRRAKHN